MTSETKSPEEIEREIERERDGLKDSIDDLQDRFSLDGVVREIGDQFRQHGGEVGRSVARSARENPIALTLTGVGLAWMIFGNNRADDRRHRSYPASPDQDRDVYRTEMPEPATRRGAAHAGPRTVPVASATRPRWARDWDGDELGHSNDSSGRSLGDTASEAGDAVKDKAADARDALASGKDAALSGASSAAQSVSSGAATAQDKAGDAAKRVRDSAGNVWSSAAHRAQVVRNRLSEGTENLSEEARERVAAARARALDARDEAKRRLDRGADQVADFYEDHPLVAGALAFAVGAAAAGALPRTRMEDDHVGGYRDDLFDEAERIFEEEKQKAERVVRAGVDEARSVAAETKADIDDRAPGDKTAVDAAADKAKSAAERVADTTRSKAKDENLGDVGKDR